MSFLLSWVFGLFSVQLVEITHCVNIDYLCRFDLSYRLGPGWWFGCSSVQETQHVNYVLLVSFLLVYLNLLEKLQPILLLLDILLALVLQVAWLDPTRKGGAYWKRNAD